MRSVIGDSLLITRDKYGVSHVFLNYCRHRGAMPACGAGNARRFTCPYHSWTYKNTGELAGLPGAPGFEGLDRSAYGLIQSCRRKRSTASSGPSSPPALTSMLTVISAR